ncbi:hypothetical protein SBOR_1459 [Sclerotinia borealis F-4128]|uniref:Cytochrome P450 n=1 Tax=Sclerotinia borealis (strain F-4128) TaxID=1432307 RepID=W9CQM9_SCLBF|nr:hypothetical protein SBOR_1459 [Sclerotinia borealis F-4128]
MAPTISVGGQSIVGLASHLSLYAGAIIISYITYKVIYNLYFHPLAKFPGPIIAAITDGWIYWHNTFGNYHKTMIDLHKKYETSHPPHGQVKQGKNAFLKGQAYNTGLETNVGIVSARDPAVHREIRKSLSHAFRAKALRLQEEVVVKYTDLLVSQFCQRGNDEKGLNLSEWYNWLTFDIIGHLAFGESFDTVKSGEGHPWISLILSTTPIHLMAVMEIFRRFPFFKKIGAFLMPKDLKEKSKVHFQNAMQKATQLMERDNNDRDDLSSHLLREKENGPKITPEFILAQSNTLIVAGSETTATLLIGLSYYLLNRPETLDNLQEEIRHAFTSSRDITSDSTAALPYLAAVIAEGLRIYPPVPMGLPRDCPGAMIDNHYVPKGAVCVSGYVTTHDEEYFTDANTFHPERWLPVSHPLYNPRHANDNKDASKPFSVGSRAGLGINLAYMEIRVVLARLM